MAKKKNEERKPDLNEADNQAEIEARIKEMMDLDDTSTPSKSIAVTTDSDSIPVSAPKLPGKKQPISIKIVDHNEANPDIPTLDQEQPDASDAKPSASADDPGVLEAIEEANRQLLHEDTEQDNSESANADDATEPEQTDDSDNVADPVLTAPELADPIEAEGIAAEQAETVPEVVEKSDTRSSENEKKDIIVDDLDDTSSMNEPDQIEKVKPLKHLDSIIPKTKVIETIESTSTDKVVDAIIAKEADELLQAQDEKLASYAQPKPTSNPKTKNKSRLKSKLLLRIFLILLIFATAYTVVTPESRYYVLNTVGVRSRASIRVLDASTQQPLKDVLVKINELEQKTNQDGIAVFDGVKLGHSEIIIQKRAFANIKMDHVIGWGSNPLADASLDPTGSQYVFIVTDFLSGKPIPKVEAISNEASALSNEKGEIKLTIDQQDDSERDVVINGENYRVEKFALNLDQKDPLDLKLVPSRKHVFISNRSGRLDVYKIDIDGQNETVILPGSGSEREDMVLISHPTDEIAALISTKDNKRNKDGFLLSTLTVLNVSDDTSKSIVTSERIQVIDWVGNRLVYVQIKEGASGDSPDRHKLMSYEYKTGDFKELATSNYFNDVLSANGHIYVAPSSTYSQNTNVNLLRINADGTSKQAIINKEVWNIFRTNYTKLTFAVAQDWYELKLGENQPGKISGEPANKVSRIYSDSPDRKRSLWIDSRDGKGVLLVYDAATGQDETVRIQGGLKMPARWLTNRVIIYRISTESETADYALNLDGGEPVKVRDVAKTSGINTWYYY